MLDFRPLPSLCDLRFRLAVRSDGVIVWKRPFSNRTKPGSMAGCLSNGYILIRFQGTLYKAHRIVWALRRGIDPGDCEIDHINRIKDDNRIQNLRLASHSENGFNKDLPPSVSSGIRGVSYDPSSKSKPWRAYWGRVKLGRFPTKEDAFNARVEAELLASMRQSG